MNGISNAPGKSKPALPELTLRDIAAPFFRHRKLVLWVFGVVFCASLSFAWLWASRYYVAKMQVVVAQDRSDPAVTAAQSAAVNNNRVVTPDQVSSEMSLLQGEDMLRQVAKTCKLDQAWSASDILLPSDPELRAAMKQEKAAQRLAKALKVESATTSDVIDVRYGKLGDPETPACVLQNLEKLYLQKHVALRRPAGSTDVFAEETENYKHALSNAELKLAKFDREEGVAVPDLVRTNLAQQVALSKAALYQAQQIIAADQQRIRDLSQQMATTPARSSTLEVSNSSSLLLQQLQATLLAAEVKKTQLLTKYEPSYPLVLEVDQEIAQTKAAISNAETTRYVNQTTDRDPTYEYLRQDRAKTEADLASQQATAAALNKTLAGMNADLISLDEKSIKQAALLRDAKATESTYLLYLSKRDQERTSDALDLRKIANVAIAVPASVPLLPAYSPLFVSFVGLILAVFLSIASAFAAEFFDSSFRTPSEVTDVLKIPVLAALPRRAA